MTRQEELEVEVKDLRERVERLEAVLAQPPLPAFERDHREFVRRIREQEG